MSPSDAGKFTNAATLAHLVEQLIAAPAVDDDTSVLDDADSDSALATDPWPPRPVSPARVGPSRNAHSRPYDDPSNYLG
jgi:hypothetical protein